MDLRIEREIAASAEETWSVLGDGFADLSWAGGVDASTLQGELGVGAVRVCRFQPNMFSKTGQARERLKHFDPATMTLAYEAIELPGVLRHGINRWSIEARDPQRCVVRSHATVELRGLAVIASPLMGLLLRRYGRDFIRDLWTEIRRRRTQPQSTAA